MVAVTWCRAVDSRCCDFIQDTQVSHWRWEWLAVARDALAYPRPGEDWTVPGVGMKSGRNDWGLRCRGKRLGVHIADPRGAWCGWRGASWYESVRDMLRCGKNNGSMSSYGGSYGYRLVLSH